MRQNNTKKIQTNTFLKGYKLICILMSEISINIVLGGKSLVGNHRGQTFLVVGRQVCSHLRRHFIPLLFVDLLQVIKDLKKSLKKERKGRSPPSLLMWCSCPVPLAEKHPQRIMFPPPCLTVGMVFLGS